MEQNTDKISLQLSPDSENEDVRFLYSIKNLPEADQHRMIDKRAKIKQQELANLVSHTIQETLKDFFKQIGKK